MIAPLQLGAADYEQIGVMVVPVGIAIAVALIRLWAKVIRVDGKIDALRERVDLIMEYFHLEPKDNDPATKTD